MENNILLLTDSYKTSHWKQYPEGTTEVYSYLESRGGKFDEITFFGLQYILKEYLVGDEVVTLDKINEAERLISDHMGPGIFNRKDWMYILDTYDGKLPIEIKAVTEGTAVPVSNVLMTVVNTDPRCFWLTNYLESLLLQVWYPITVATTSRECKKLIKDSLRRTMDFKNQEEMDSSLNFKLHDFGYRGVSSSESAAIGGMAHLVSFRGTDTMPAISAASVYYGSTPAGFSVPASEHSTITSWGRESETEAIENMLDKYPTGPVACVMDSYSIDASTKHIVGKLKDKILARDGVFVVRPDSGDIKMTMNVVLNNLWGVFGGRVTGEGYKVLDPHIRVIQGDGMNYDSLKELLNYIEQIGFSTENVAFGMGGALLQIINRDTQKFAFKCSSIKVNGEYRDVQKSPTEIDANGDKHTSFKKSKPGKLALFRGDNGIHTVCNPVRASKHDLLHTVYFNGDLFIDTSLEDVRKRSDIGL